MPHFVYVRHHYFSYCLVPPPVFLLPWLLARGNICIYDTECSHKVLPLYSHFLYMQSVCMSRVAHTYSTYTQIHAQQFHTVFLVDP